MRLKSLHVQNYRTLEDISIEFPTSYTAICGPNDSGKTNVVRALRALVRGDSTRTYFYSENEEVTIKDDFSKWNEVEAAKRTITINLCVELDHGADTGFYEFVLKQLEIGAPKAAPLTLSLSSVYRAEKADPIVSVTCGSQTYDGIPAQEVFKKLQSSQSLLFHNSTMQDTYRGAGSVGFMREIWVQHESRVEEMKRTVTKGLAKISRLQQEQFQDLLGRLSTKYKVGLSLPVLDFGYMPFSMTLGDKRFEVSLDDWGSGTKNRTLILLTLFRARQVMDAEASAAKITPILVIEEPESFLHPAAQAEFGRVLQDLAEEFGVQVIVTTHSPYLLNPRSPLSNILFQRQAVRGQVRETVRVDTTNENWMAPFALALGIESEEFKPWKTLFQAQSEKILLVEGDVDKEYLELLCDEVHGANRLQIEPKDIVSYGGASSLSNNILLKFVKNRHPKFFVTFDMDATSNVEKTLRALQLEKAKHYTAIGQDSAGRRCIEGLVPDRVTAAVHAANTDLVLALTSGKREEKESAKGRLKRMILAEFKKDGKPNTDDYSAFYKCTERVIA